MHSVLSESLDVLLPNLLPTLVCPDKASGLKALASQLAPILCGGFECRLKANAPQVDFQQCIKKEENKMTLLQEHIAEIVSARENAAQPEWSRLQNFLTAWRSSLESIPEIWLEFDLHTPSKDLIDQVKDRGKMDIIDDLAYPLTLGLNCEILGIPQQEVLQP
ncbi:MAG: hypothetical protein AB4426_25990 [Xenococcaceae cyanobacterium]